MIAIGAAFNGGDILFQFIAFLFLLFIPMTVALYIFLVKKRNSRLDRLEEKVDHLLRKIDEKDKNSL